MIDQMKTIGKKVVNEWAEGNAAITNIRHIAHNRKTSLCCFETSERNAKITLLIIEIKYGMLFRNPICEPLSPTLS